MMGRTELCAWLRANSSGIYRPADDAAAEIEHLAAAKDRHFAQAMANGAKANEYRAALVNLRAGIFDAKNTNIVDYIDSVLGAVLPNAKLTAYRQKEIEMERIKLTNAAPVDKSLEADANRMRWLLNGNGYFMEEQMLCGHSPCDEEEQDGARREIDNQMDP